MRLLVVLGMHRSGTSLVAGMLQQLGWDVGPDDQLMPAKPDNPRGFVEHLPAVRVNDRLLHRLGGSWKRPPAFAPGWEHDDDLDAFREEAAGVVAALAERDEGPVLLKDPRFCLTLPFWQTVADVDDALLVLRPPVPVIRSLVKREDDLDTEAVARLWLRHVLTALRHGVPLRLVDPRDLLGEDDGLATLARSLGHEPSDEQLAAARGQVEGDLWGRSSRGTSTDPDGPAVAAAVRVHAALTGGDAATWQATLGQLTTVEEVAEGERLLDTHRTELAITTQDLRQQVKELTSALDDAQARADRLFREREQARAALDG